MSKQAHRIGARVVATFPHQKGTNHATIEEYDADTDTYSLRYYRDGSLGILCQPKNIRPEITVKENVPFSSLSVGTIFEFASIRESPYTGFEHGPWIKLSTRRYQKAEKYNLRPMTCTVGTTRARVDILG